MMVGIQFTQPTTSWWTRRYYNFTVQRHCGPSPRWKPGRNPVNSKGSGCPRLTSCRDRLLKFGMTTAGI